jgi:hypothetical protein
MNMDHVVVTAADIAAKGEHVVPEVAKKRHQVGYELNRPYVCSFTSRPWNAIKGMDKLR